ncbi:hypothetical protein ACFYOY_13680 [Streptomyces sp. NPDC007875]|uniref:hypothetical protein n=1 Tax=Streptomyces sp. NPDC007875 TaxID=3364783 RepID=UPI0036883C45
MSAPLIAIDVALLVILLRIVTDLADSLESCRANVAAEQDEHSAYRLANPPRREAP